MNQHPFLLASLIFVGGTGGRLAAQSPDCNANGVLDALDLLPSPSFRSTAYDTADFPFSLVTTAVNRDGEVVPFDSNLDGRPDVAVAHHVPGQISIHPNNGVGNGQGSLQPGVFTTFSAGNASWSIEAGDMDGDGDPDLLWLSWDTEGLVIFFNNGLGFYPEKSAYLAGHRVSDTVIADLNGDGDLDIAALREGDNNENVIEILLNDGDGNFANQDSRTFGNGRSLAAADFDLDGDLDLAADSGDSILLLSNDGGGAFPLESSLPVEGSLTSLITMDVDRDGRHDLVAASHTGGNIQILRGLGGFQFADPVIISLSGRPGWMNAADMNEDGNEDLVVSDFQGTQITLLRNTGAGAFAGPIVLENAVYGDQAPPTGVSDINGDGISDLVTVGPNMEQLLVHTTRLHLPVSTDCNGNGIPDACELVESLVYQSLDPIPTGEADFADPVAVLTTAIGPRHQPVPLDLNQDGLVDLVTGNPGNGTISVLLNLGMDEFGNWLGYGVPVDYDTSAASSFAAADLDGDGRLDILASSNFDGDIHIYYGDGTGQFTPQTISIDSDNNPEITLGDFNRDDLLDIAVVGRNDNAVFLIRNLDNRQFEEPRQFPVGEGPQSLGIGDINQDGYIDLAVANATEGSVSWLLNEADGTGSLMSPVSLALGQEPGRVRLADLNGDAYPEMLVVDEPANSLFVLENEDGNFHSTSVTTYHAGSFPTYVFPSDLNRDGFYDVAVANRNANTLTLLINNGNGLLASKTELNTGEGARRAVAAGDFNADGRTDLATANEFDETVSIFLHQETIPPSGEDANNNFLLDTCEEYVLGQEIPRPEGADPEQPLTKADLDPPNAAFWHQPTGKLYATGFGYWKITWKTTEGDPIVTEGFNVWPEDQRFQIHVAGTPPVDLTANGRFGWSELMEQESGGIDPNEVSNGHAFSAGQPGRSLIMLSPTTPQQDAIYFQFVKSIRWDDPKYLEDDFPATIGEEITDIEGFHDPDAGGPWIIHALSRYCPDEIGANHFYDRQTRTGPIIPVNTDDPVTPDDDLVVVYYEAGGHLIEAGSKEPQNTQIGWPYQPVRYQVEWPEQAPEIIIASQLGTGPIDPEAFRNWDLYYQNDPQLPGFNPNDEHALRLPTDAGEAVFPLRSDLGTSETSEPYVLIKYQDPDQGNRPAIKVFRVLVEKEPYFLQLEGTAGQLIQPPFPLSVLPRAAESTGVSGPFWRDRNLDFWSRAAGDDGGTAEVVMRYHYPFQSQFFMPGVESPPAGTPIPWLDEYDGTPGTPVDILYLIDWPENVPVLRVGETLVKPKAGLPDISSQSSAEIIYEQSEVLGAGDSARLIDPTREIQVDLPALPGDVAALPSGGRMVFPDLPPHLRPRLSYDPAGRKLGFRGVFVEPPSGESYLLLNVIGDRDKAAILALSTDSGFQSAVQALGELAAEPIEVGPESMETESLAITAGAATGTGYITLAFGNDPDRAEPGEPVAVEIVRVDCPRYQGEVKTIPSRNPFDERLTMRHSGDFAGDSDQFIFEWRTHPPEAGGLPTQAPEEWNPFPTEPASGQGAVDVTIGGPGLLALSDNYFICRYRRMRPDGMCGGEFSEWTDPQLAEGWIKRVLGEIDPFTQRAEGGSLEGAEARFYDYNREVNTIVSMISQAGPRASGKVPLNLDAVDDFGLIEIYETVLDRGKALSVDGTPPINYGPANDALLLATSRLADLYMLLGNEAFADAADPTIAFGTEDGVYGSQASSLHCFMNQTDSLLEEELVLLRGRDASFQPSVETPPVYNRLFWNFTRDITGGEVAYALNYNVRNEDGDVSGTIDESDARVLYPQGHGDAWGHYLTAIKKYYQLFRNPNFTWVPRSEAVLVGGSPVSVDFLDERKFARAAAARARTGAKIVNLTYRRHYVEDPEGQWQGYRDSDPERAWGLTGWAGRAGEGAYFDWVAGNALLPPEDTEHTGIQKIDRRTVAELRDIPTAFDAIQQQLDMADQGLNPLGLAKNVLPFDIDPAQVAEGESHFEQIYSRAVAALNNAIAVFNHANNSTQLLRRQTDQVADFRQNVEDREADFQNRLLEVFGYPYPDDIGPGGTYPTDYEGPDIYHFDYYDPGELLGIDPPPTESLVVRFREPSVSDSGELTEDIHEVEFNISTSEFGLVKPTAWTGRRRAPGEIQMARSDLMQLKTRFEKALIEYRNLIAQIEDQAALIEAQHNLDAEEIHVLNESVHTTESLNQKIKRSRERQLGWRTASKAANLYFNAWVEMLPVVLGPAAADTTSVARGTLRLTSAYIIEALSVLADVEALTEMDHRQAKEIAQARTNIRLTTLRQEGALLHQVAQVQNLVRHEASLRLEIYTVQEALQQSIGRYRATLARGQRLLEERLRFRKQVAAQIQQFRYQDMAFRIFRNDAVQKYRAQFDLAATYVYMAARAYDYESNLLQSDSRGPGQEFLTEIIRTRSLGVIQNGLPQTGSGDGDAGLADPMARMKQNWLVLEGQLGFNNPQHERNRFSLRKELFRIPAGGIRNDELWRETLEQHLVPNVLNLAEFNRYARPFSPQLPQEPAIVIPFSTVINFGQNFFGWPLGGGDSAYDSSNFATKIQSVGVWFANYDATGLSQTPRVYLLPVGSDILRSPTGDTGAIREWKILDQRLPLPFPLNGTDLEDPDWIPLQDSLSQTFAEIRRFSSFRAYHDSGTFNQNEMTFDGRLIGRSVWNTRWFLIIPGGTLLSDRDEALDRFIHGRLIDGRRTGDGVKDILLLFQTYAHSGN